MSNRVSLSDVARSSGFAVPTVSMALRGVGTVGAATREKIREAARALGYSPNPLLASLASKHFGDDQRGGTPLALFYFPFPQADDEMLMQRIIGAQQEHAGKLGYRLEPFKMNDFKDGAQATRMLFSRGFQGILLPEHFELEMLPGMDWSRFSVVGWGENLIGSSNSPQPFLYRATVNHFGVILRAWDETMKRGYRRIGFALFNQASISMDDQLRWGAARNCLSTVTARNRIPPFVLKGGIENELASQDLAKWVRRYRPDAIIGFNGYFRWALEHEGFRVPQDVGFAALHQDVDLVEKDDASGMKEMRLGSMLAALELLDQQIRHHQYGMPRESRTLMIHSDWIEGTTLPDKSKRQPSEQPARRTAGA
jgi:LacI family transcriptional regulator